MQNAKHLIRGTSKQVTFWLQRGGNDGIKKQISTTAVRYDQRTLGKLKTLQAIYQAEDGRPVWLKAGFRDRILYTCTILLCAIGLVQCFVLYYEHIKPASWRKK